MNKESDFSYAPEGVKDDWNSLMKEISNASLKVQREKFEHFDPQFLDTQSSNYDASQVLKVIKERRQLYKDHKIDQQEGHIKIKTNMPITIIPIGDIHWGSIYTNYDLFEDHRKKILETPGVYTVLMHNLVDNGMPGKFPSNTLSNGVPPAEQFKSMQSYIRELDKKGKILGAVTSDCHEGWCVSAESTALSKDRGWINDPKIGEKILTLNMFTKKFEYMPVEDVYENDYEGEMIHIENDNVDLLCTPNHKLFYQASGRTYYHEAKYLNDINNAQFWQVAEFCKKDDGSKRKSYLNAIKLVAWLVTEGTYSSQRNSLRIYQSTKNKEYSQRIENILDKNRIKYRKFLSKSGFGGADVNTYEFKAKKDFMKRWFPDGDIHRIPRRIYKFDKQSREIFLRELMMGDGAKREFTYTTAKKELADDVQELAIKTRIKATIRKRSDGVFSIYMKEPDGRNGGDYIYFRYKKSLRRESYKGKIWCPSTKNGTFVVRRNGRVCVTGNSWQVAGVDASALLYGFKGRKFPIIENGGILTVNVGVGKDSQDYGLGLWHKQGPFNSRFNPEHALRQNRRLYHEGRTDIEIGAHYHNTAASANYEGSRDLQKIVNFIRVGTYKGVSHQKGDITDRWSVDKFGNSGNLPGASVTLWNSRHMVDNDIDFDTAIEKHMAIRTLALLKDMGLDEKIMKMMK